MDFTELFVEAAHGQMDTIDAKLAELSSAVDELVAQRVAALELTRGHDWVRSADVVHALGGDALGDDRPENPPLPTP